MGAVLLEALVAPLAVVKAVLDVVKDVLDPAAGEFKAIFQPKIEMR